MNKPLGFPFGFQILDNAPVDDRYIWNTLADVIAAPAGIKYEGMFPIYVKGTQKFYYLDATLAPIEVDFTGGGTPPEVPEDISELTDTTGVLPSLIAFDGNRTVKRSGIPNVNVGGSSLTEFLNNYFFPFIPATISLSALAVVYEQGTANNVTVAGSVTGNDETSFSDAEVISPSDGDAVVDTFTAQVGNFSIIDSGVSAYKTYRARINVGGDGTPGTILSALKIVEFIHPFFWGMNELDLAGDDIYNLLTKSVTKQSTKVVLLNGSAKHIYFCYPESYPDLTSIKDQNGYEVLDSFTQSLVTVESSGLSVDWTLSYKVYKTPLTTANNAQFIFTF